MLVYHEKDNLIHKLHPFTLLAFIGVILTLALVLSNPVCLLGLLFAVGIVIIAADIFKEWRVYLRYCWTLIVLILVINAIFTRVGDTILYESPRLPLLGGIKVTLEALVFGAGMGVRLLIIISVFCLYTYAIHPDKVLKLFNRGGNKSVLIIILSTRLFPLLMKDFSRITEVQRCRGVKFDTGTRWQRVKNLLPVISVLLQSCLERSLQLAESMCARGYGSGNRSYYDRELWRTRDYLILVGITICLVIGVFSAVTGWCRYNYYPRLSEITLREIVITSIMTLTLMIPAILNWGWNKWPLLKSKI